MADSPVLIDAKGCHLTCPNCGDVFDLSEEARHGKLPTEHLVCGYHKTVNWQHVAERLGGIAPDKPKRKRKAKKK